MYHYKLRGKPPSAPGPPGSQPTTAGPVTVTDDEYGYQSELHWNFKWANIPCSSARLVEFWYFNLQYYWQKCTITVYKVVFSFLKSDIFVLRVLMVLDFDTRTWTVKKFGPYDLNDFAFASKLDDQKKVTIGQVDIIQPGLP